ncbi:MAG: hypothetical protein ACAH89_10125 [Rariglobus sp.]|nr:hypothetical protein [Rariglobus sp.]
MKTGRHSLCRTVAALMIGLILLLVIGGTSPEVHDHLCSHHRGDAGTDHCVINAFAGGEGYAAPVPVMVAPFIETVEATLVADVRLEFQPADFDLPPACGPPVGSLNLS